MKQSIVKFKAMFKFIRKAHSKGPAACHCAAEVPGGFSQPFFRLHRKGFTHLHTQREPNIPSKHKAAVGLPDPQRGLSYSRDAWRGGPGLRHSPLNSPVTVISDQTGRKPLALGHRRAHHSLSPGFQTSAKESGKRSLGQGFERKFCGQF